MDNRVAIIIINYNSSNYLNVTLSSIKRANTKVDYTIGVIDNGSSDDDRKKVEKIVSEWNNCNTDKSIVFVESNENLGFSGANNKMIKELLKDPKVTHVCLLNSDVVVTDFWLDYLIEKNEAVIGPVTNAAGNEQTIQIDYTLDSKDEFSVINSYAQKRHSFYKGYKVYTDLVTFFATLIRRDVIDKVGYLDERFWPGSYEDDDYCKRIINEGFKIAIARDCFIHHFGSGSFSKLEMTRRQSIGDENRKRYEEKWNELWTDRTWKLLESCKQDYVFVSGHCDNEWALKIVESSMKEIEKLISDWAAAIQFFTAQNNSVEVAANRFKIAELCAIISYKIKRRLSTFVLNKTKQIKKKINEIKNYRNNKKKIEQLMDFILKVVADKKKVICVFAPIFTVHNERDGYIQRIKAIDSTALTEQYRIYLLDEGTENENITVTEIDDSHLYIKFNSFNWLHRKFVFAVLKKYNKLYIHSILRFMPDKTSKKMWTIFKDNNSTIFWDVHGAVPEEYKLSGAEVGYSYANEIESIIAKRANYIIVVTEAMQQYLVDKYSKLDTTFVVLPILNKELLEYTDYESEKANDDIIITYAGGTQPWQNIGMMQEMVSKTVKHFKYCFYMPDPDEFWRQWNYDKTEDIKVESLTPEELYVEYRKCHYGFVLRDDSPVNNVACPTKIVEYLHFGIVPILKSSAIGDFVKMGMKYIDCTTLLDYELSDEDRKEFVRENYIVLKKLKDLYVSNLNQLVKYVEI